MGRGLILRDEFVDVDVRHRRRRITGGVFRVGAGGDFGAIAPRVAVGIRVLRIGGVGSDFRAVRKAVAIGIGQRRARAVGVDFGAVGQAIAIGIGVRGIGAALEFLRIGQTVGIVIVGPRFRAGVEVGVPRVRQTVIVGVGEARDPIAEDAVDFRDGEALFQEMPTSSNHPRQYRFW